MDIEEHNNKVRVARMDREKEQDEKRQTVIRQLTTIAKSEKDFQTIMDDSITVLSLSTVKITIEEIRKICKIYNDTNMTQEGLDNANNLFKELDHTNNGIVELSHDSVGLKYL